MTTLGQRVGFIVDATKVEANVQVVGVAVLRLLEAEARRQLFATEVPAPPVQLQRETPPEAVESDVHRGSWRHSASQSKTHLIARAGLRPNGLVTSSSPIEHLRDPIRTPQAWSLDQRLRTPLATGELHNSANRHSSDGSTTRLHIHY